MHVLVTGGAGYIGSITSQALLDAGHEVTVLDNLSRGRRDVVPKAARFVQADPDDEDAITRIAALGLDACVYMAAFIQVGESLERPDVYLENNASKAVRHLDLLIRHGVDRFVFSSSAAVYGVPSINPIPVDHERRPVNPYGVSKAMVEDALEARGSRLRFAVLRYFNAAGAGGGRGEDHLPETHLIPRVLDVAAGRSPVLEIFGSDWGTPDGTCIRDYVHVLDLAEAHIRALDALGSHEAIVCNVGTGRGVSVLEVAQACRSVTGHPIPSRSAPRRPGDVAELVADPTSARALLGWTPRVTDITDLVSSAWEWHRRHVDDPR